MNGRLYDPYLQRFLSPDPGACPDEQSDIGMQAPGNAQNFNRYSYCLNNPLMYTDPSGESLVLVAALLGAYINAYVQVRYGSVNTVGGMFMAAGVGALSGITGGWAGGAIAGTLGMATTMGSAMLNGAITGAVGGFAGGFVGGAGNAWISGANFGQGLKAGLIGGGIGALGGAIIGGIQGGFQLSKQKSIFARLDDGSITTTPDGKLVASNETLDEFSDKFFKEYKYRDRLRNIYNDELVRTTVGDGHNAFTSNVLIDGKYNIYYANSAFDSKLKLFLTMGHEYVHVAHFVNISSLNQNYSDYAAYKWESNVTSYNKDYSRLRLERGMTFLRKEGIYTLTPQIQLKLNPYENFRSWGLPLFVPHF